MWLLLDFGCLLCIRLLVEQIVRLRTQAMKRGNVAAMRASALLVPIPMGLLLTLAVVSMSRGLIASVSLLVAGGVGLAALAKSR